MGEEDRSEGGDQTGSQSTQFKESYDWSATKPSLAVIDALATVANIDPCDLRTEFETTLNHHIDPGSLNAIVGGGRSGRTVVTFTFEDYDIRFDGFELEVRLCDR